MILRFTLLLAFSCLCSLVAHSQDNTQTPAAGTRVMIAKRGSSPSELAIGDYIIAGAFKEEANAKKYQGRLIDLGLTTPDYGFSTDKGLWYVYITRHTDIDVARQERDNYRELDAFRNAWVLSVVE